MTPKQLEKIHKAPYLEKEDFLLQLQINNEPPYVNLKRERDVTVYSKFLEENGYDCSLLVDLKKPILEGRWILEAIKTPVERNLDLSQIKDLAGLLGQQIEDEIDFWLEEYEPDLKKIIGKLDELKFSGLPLEVYSHYLEIYNSAVGLFGAPDWKTNE